MGQIIAEISQPGRYTIQRPFADAPTATFQGLNGDDAAKHIHIEERFEKTEVSWTIFNNRFHNAIENTLVNAPGLSFVFQWKALLSCTRSEPYLPR